MTQVPLKILVAVAVLIGAAQPAIAAERTSWTGFYAGLTAGVGKTESDLTSDLQVCPTCTFDPFYTDGEISAIESSGSPSLEDTHFVGGVTVGYTRQLNRWVLGVETDISTFRFQDSYREAALTPDPPPFLAPFAYDTRTSFETKWLATARTRIGVLATPDLLIYATGGLAASRVTVTNRYSDDLFPPATGNSSNSKLKYGWVVGGGIEWAICDGWSLKGEYLRVDLGRVKTTANVVAPPFDPSAFRTEADLTSNIGRVGLNFRF